MMQAAVEPIYTNSQRQFDPAARDVSTHKAVLVHAGARDSYQLALGLADAGLLEELVTDLFWSEDRGWARHISERIPLSLRAMLRRRSCQGLSPDLVHILPAAGIGGMLLDKLPRIPFAIKQRCVRGADATLGHAAGRRAKQRGAGLVSYSYTGYDAFRAYGRGGMLFQMHPHPATMRRILRRELELHPECKASLEQEWELSLPERDFDHLVRETEMASCFLAASSFTRDSLIENGAISERVTVVPYGVDLQRFRPNPERRTGMSLQAAKLKLLFVGRINQRKGLAYLLEALRLLNTAEVELTICGRVLDDLKIFRPFGEQVKIRPSVSADDLVRAYQESDLFVFPSVGEGFGQVLLESLACGLPILATTHTAAPDLITDRQQGFVVEPRRPDQLAQRIEWALQHRNELREMGQQARERAERFTWQRFREATAAAVRRFLAEDGTDTHESKETA